MESRDTVYSLIDFFASLDNPWEVFMPETDETRLGAIEFSKVLFEHSKIAIPRRLAKTREPLCLLWHGSFLWSYQRRLEPQLAGEYLLETRSGLLGTGYYFVTPEALYIEVIAALRDKFPVVKEPSFLRGFLLEGLKRAAGYRERMTHADTDHSWRIPLTDMVALQYLPPSDSIFQSKTLVVKTMGFAIQIFIE